MHTPSLTLPAQVLAALAQGRTLEAIKLLRTATGLDLKECKQVIDEHLRHHPLGKGEPAAPTRRRPSDPQVIETLRRGGLWQALRLSWRHIRSNPQEPEGPAAAATNAVARSQGAPGEVPRSSGLAGLTTVLLLLAAALVAYYLLGR